MNNLFAALATGNPMIVAFTGALVALNAVFKDSTKYLTDAARAENQRLKYEDAKSAREARIQ